MSQTLLYELIVKGVVFHKEFNFNMVKTFFKLTNINTRLYKVISYGNARNIIQIMCFFGNL